MKKRFYKFVNLVLLCCAMHANAQTGINCQKHFSAEFDPAPFFQKGYSVAAGYEFAHWRVSANIFSAELPSFAVQHDWNVKIQTGSALRLQYYFNEERKGVFTGVQAGVLTMNYKKEGKTEATTVTQFALTPTAGYRWFPFSNNGIYLMPAAGVGFTLSTSGDVYSGTEKYDQFKPAFIAALHIGCRF